MKTLLRFVTSSIGKKLAMSVTGFLMMGFLVGHLTGNLLMYKSAHTFDAYADTLKANPLLIPIELVLLAILACHAFFACWVRYENWVARPEPYAADRTIGERTFASATMLYTGGLIVFFLIVHLINFKFALPEGASLHALVLKVFAQTGWTTFYLACMVVLGLHLSHGFRSAFQSLGVLWAAIDAPVKKLGLAFTLVIAGGFLLFPVWAYLR